MATLAPLVDEARRLEQAFAALEGLDVEEDAWQPETAAPPKAPRKAENVSDTALLVKARELREFGVPELATALGAQQAAVARRVAALARSGALVRRGGKGEPNGRWAVRAKG